MTVHNNNKINHNNNNKINNKMIKYTQ